VGPVLPTKVCLTTVIWTELRREFGVRRDRGIELVPLSDEMDVAAPEVVEEPCHGLFEAAVAAGVINENQAVLVAQTRVEGRGLAEIARDLGRPYDAVQKDRRRAEHALGSFARSYGAEGPR
jgi:DNA-directed RNA polymerase specialized sigma24 family protein